MKINFDDFNNDRMINDPANYKWGIFYFNPKDSRILVPKFNKIMGWTLNFAKMNSWIILFGTLAAILIAMWLG
jgi:uncharacterized membrane protein